MGYLRPFAMAVDTCYMGKQIKALVNAANINYFNLYIHGTQFFPFLFVCHHTFTTEIIMLKLET